MMTNPFENKNLLFLKKKRWSPFYGAIMENIIEYGKPAQVICVEWIGSSNIAKINRQLDRNLKSGNIDIFISLGYYFIDPTTLHNIQGKVWRIRFDGDDPVIFDYYTKYYAQLFDLNLTTSPVVRDKLRKLGFNSIAIPSFFNSRLSKKEIEPASGYQHDVSFVGIIKGRDSRPRYMSFLKEQGIDVAWFGEGSSGGHIEQDGMCQVFRNSKINLNFTGLDTEFFKLSQLQHQPDIFKRNQIKGRPFEVCAAGGFVLTEYSIELDEFFEVGKELDVFRDEKELLEKIRYYLAHSEIRESIAANGSRAYADNYEYHRYMPKLLADIEKYSGQLIEIDQIVWGRNAEEFLVRYVTPENIREILQRPLLLKWVNVSSLWAGIGRRLLRRKRK